MINNLHRNRRGFTLIELIVVIAVLLVLVTIAVPKFIGQTQKATITKHLASAKSVEDAANIYNIEHNRFPRLSETAYTSTEVTAFADKIHSITGEEVTLDPNGNYYDIDYVALKDYVTVPDEKDKGNYILQNPVGKIYYLEGIKDGRMDGVDFGTTNPEAGKSEEKPTTSMRQKERDEWVAKGYSLVETAEDLDNVRNNLSGKYIQVAHINLSSYDNWEPIGTMKNAFVGTYNGGGFSISELSINKPSQDYVGLFGRIPGGTIKNTTLINSNIIGRDFVGGLVADSYKGTVITSSFIGSVKGRERVGGLVGSNWLGTLENAYSQGDIQGVSRVGGLVGYNDGTIMKSYSVTNIVDGGLIGENYGGPTNNYPSTVLDSYSNGNILIKKNWGRCKIQNSSIKSIENLKNKAIYTNWDFNSIWEISPGEYPKLQQYK